MNIKKFKAVSASEAIRMVKDEMGSEAVILKTRTIPQKGSNSENDGQQIEITAAVDYDSFINTDKRMTNSGEEKIYKRWESLELQLGEIKDALWSLEAGSLLKSEFYFNQNHKDRYSCFKTLGLRPEVVRNLMTMENSGGHKAEGDSGKTQQERWRECLLTVLDKIGIKGETDEKKGRQIFSFVGPTGVGKTTSLAKLAAQKAVEQGKKVALITIDTFRIAAVAQLETYARIMSVPLEVVSNRNELQRAIRRHESCDVIFIDTAGRSPNNSKDIDELKGIFKIPQKIHHFLVLSATTQYQNMLYADDRFNVLPLRSYIFTKLDEVEDSSPMVNFLISRPKPVSYFTTGQQVPEDIEPATKKRLAAMMLSRRHFVSAEQRDEVA